MSVPRRILVGSMPRSGGTWTYNAMRLALEKTGHNVYATFVKWYEPDNTADIHLVKVHALAERPFDADLTLTTHRDLAECLASLIRMGWLPNDPATIRKKARGQTHMYRGWHKLTDLELDFRTIVDEPAVAVRQLAVASRLELSDEQVDEIVAELVNMSVPQKGMDKTTLIHRRHRAETDTQYDGPGPDDIRAVLADT